MYGFEMIWGNIKDGFLGGCALMLLMNTFGHVVPGPLLP